MNAQEILHRHKLVRTSCREGILDVMLSAGQALSEHEIRLRLLGNYDRTTFYRSFKTLIEKEIVHKVVVDGVPTKYAIEPPKAQGSHFHFYCTDCQSVLCFEMETPFRPQVPPDFSVEETEVIVKGRCKNCNG